MKFEEYYISNKDGKSNCVVRSFCKLYNKEYDEVYNDLVTLSNKLNSSSFNDIIVFEKYMENNNTYKIDYGEGLLLKDLKLEKGSYIVFCYDKKDYYHMVTIIDNILYDKNSNSLLLYVISIYKENNI